MCMWRGGGGGVGWLIGLKGKGCEWDTQEKSKFGTSQILPSCKSMIITINTVALYMVMCDLKTHYISDCRLQ